MDARLGRAVETLDAMLRDEAAANTFDLCFIDADKRAYGDYFDRAMQLVRALVGSASLARNVSTDSACTAGARWRPDCG